MGEDCESWDERVSPFGSSYTVVGGDPQTLIVVAVGIGTVAGGFWGWWGLVWADQRPSSIHVSPSDGIHNFSIAQVVFPKGRLQMNWFGPSQNLLLGPREIIASLGFVVLGQGINEQLQINPTMKKKRATFADDNIIKQIWDKNLKNKLITQMEENIKFA
ncbi:Uncharacterized protein Fot_02153 [Forsythia ovata]|uniref:Photosystem I assembly protein Ycf4 n=1 Tax=Forsythia ovata TaxID=205694 RepID=A0ABD1X610_9LAMI